MDMPAAASFADHPLHAPTSSHSTEELEEFRQSLSRACAILEQARVQEAELEALLLFGSSILWHQPEAATATGASAKATADSTVIEVNLEDVPYGGIQDGWHALASVVNRTGAASAVADSMDSDAILVPKVTAVLEPSVSSDKNQHQPHRVRLRRGGQLAKAAYRDCLAGTLKRAAEVAASIRSCRLVEGPALRQAMAVARQVSQQQQLNPSSSSPWLTVFDERYQSIKAYHASRMAGSPSSKRPRLGNPVADGYDLVGTVQMALQPLAEEETGEEVYGKYLDLRSSFDYASRNLKDVFALKTSEKNGGSALLYSDYLRMLLKGLPSRPEAPKIADRKKYVRFLSLLDEYLRSFLQRTSPLLRIDDVLDPAHKEFDEEWGRSGGVEGWTCKPGEAGLAAGGMSVASADATASSGGPIPPSAIDLSQYESASDLAAEMDCDRLKAELSRLGLKCGGTIQDRAARLFLTKNTPLDQLPAKLFAKKDSKVGGGAPAASPAAGSAGHGRRVDVARREAAVTALLNQLRPTLEATLRRIERRQTQTLEEQEKELAEELYEADVRDEKERAARDGDSDDEDDDAPIYNPKNVPLDWDGKPIPYWLFKLHGLNHYYPCEICGGESYRGRRNFEMHFAEQKHALGMKSLGIPNTRHFHGITKIEDATALWETLQAKLTSEQFDTSREEEYEDSQGNVLSRATYEDLARQGLL
jgi:splicing factor 3A subunit 3